MSAFGLIGTITSDEITLDSGKSNRGLGGILYQAAVLCGLGESVFLYSNCGFDLKPEVADVIGGWGALRTEGLKYVPGPGNRVFLTYDRRARERRETLQSVVPPLQAGRILAGLSRLDFLVMVFNSGYDIPLDEWRRVIVAASCPIWLDIHSLVLARCLCRTRSYAAFPDWRDWVRGVDYLQANLQEAACLLGHPESRPESDELSGLAVEAFKVGVRGVLVTMGEDGVRVETPEGLRVIRPPKADAVIDATGCGDVFAAKTAQSLAHKKPLFESTSAGVDLASLAVRVTGVRETFNLARRAAAGKGTII